MRRWTLISHHDPFYLQGMEKAETMFEGELGVTQFWGLFFS